MKSTANRFVNATMNVDREVRTALEQTQASLANSRRELERIRAEHQAEAEQLRTRARLAEKEAVTNRLELDRLRAERELLATRLQAQRARPLRVEPDHQAVATQGPVIVGPDQSNAEVMGPAERWVMRGSGIVLLVLCVVAGELNVCGVLLGAGLLTVSFLG